MPRFKLLLNGRNLLLDLGEGYKKMGFYTPRYVDASDEMMARSTAIEDFIHSTKYNEIKGMMMNTSDDLPLFDVEELEECNPNEFYENGKETGLVFYTEDQKYNANHVIDPTRCARWS